MNIANKLTLLRIVLIPVFIVFFYIDVPYKYHFATLVFIIASLTDLFDGKLARKHDIVTNFGKLVDPIADKLLVSSALVMLAALGWVHEIIVIILIGREFIVSGLRLLAAAKGVVLAASMLGKIKTVVQIVAICAVLLQDGFFRSMGIPFGEILMWVSVGLAVVSLADYFLKNKAVLQDLFD